LAKWIDFESDMDYIYLEKKPKKIRKALGFFADQISNEDWAYLIILL